MTIEAKETNEKLDLLAAFREDPDLSLIPKLADVEAPPTNWIVEDLVAEGGYHLITGCPGAMKSMLALHMAYGISKGTDLFGRETVQKHVVYIDKENPIGLIKERQSLLGITDESNLSYWGGWAMEVPVVLRTVHLMPELAYVKLSEKYKPVLVFDSMIRFHSCEENDATAMSNVSAYFRSLCDRGATVIVLHHQGKAFLSGRSPFRGSSEIEAGCDIAYSITKKKAGESQTLDIECFKNRHAPETEFGLRFDAENGLFLPQSTDLEKARQHNQAQIQEIATLIQDNPGIAFDDIQAKTGIAEKKLREILNEGKGVKWSVKPGPHNKHQHFPCDVVIRNTTEQQVRVPRTTTPLGKGLDLSTLSNKSLGEHWEKRFIEQVRAYGRDN